MRIREIINSTALAAVSCWVAGTAFGDDAKADLKPAAKIEVPAVAAADVKTDDKAKPDDAKSTTAADAKTAAGAKADDKPKAHAKVSASRDPACMTQTGSRIPVHRKDCAAIGRSYSNDDVKQTGATNAGAALHMLDSGIAPARPGQ